MYRSSPAFGGSASASCFGVLAEIVECECLCRAIYVVGSRLSQLAEKTG